MPGIKIKHCHLNQVGRDLIEEELAQTDHVKLECYKFYASSMGFIFVLGAILSYAFFQVSTESLTKKNLQKKHLKSVGF